MTADVRGKRNGQGVRFACALFFTAFFFVALTSYHIYNLSSFETVERIGLAATKELIDIQPLVELYRPEMMRLAEHDPDASVTVPGLNIPLDIKAAEIKNIPEEQLGESIMKSLIRQIYYKGFSTILKPADIAGINESELGDLTGVADTFINKEFNDRVRLIFYIALVFSVLTAIPFFFFSRAFEKITGFGGSFIVVGMPGLLVSLTKTRVESMMQDGNVTSSLMTTAILPFIEQVQYTYLIVLLLGVGLFLGGMSGIFLSRKKVYPVK